MLHFRLSTRLLLAAAFLLMASVTSAERAISCDHNFNVHRLSCDSGVLSVLSALYGRADREICHMGVPPEQLNNTECSQQGTVDVLKERCDGKKVCEIRTSLLRTSDPCRGIFKYLDTNYTCLPAIRVISCEHSYTTLDCDDGQIISIYGASYGRSDQTTCSYGRPTSEITDVNCRNPTGEVAEICNGKNSCTLKASNSVFGDPCKGTFKYLELSYVCEYPGFAP